MKLEHLGNDRILIEMQLDRSKTILRESCEGLTRSQRQVVENVYQHFLPLIEATLNAQQVEKVFQDVENHPKNKTAAGRAAGAAAAAGKGGVEAVKKANEILNKAGGWLQNTKPVQNFDQKFEDLKTKVVDKLGGEDSKIVQQVQRLGDLAKANPGKTAAVVGVMTVLAGLAGGPIAGLVAGQVLRGTVELVKGEKLSTAAGKGVKAAALGALAGMTFDAIGDSVVDNIAIADAQDLENMLQSFDEANLESAMAGISPEYAELLDELEGARNLRIQGNVNRFFFNYDVILTTEQYQEYNQLNTSVGQAMRQHGSFSDEAMVKTAEFHNFMAGVQNDPIQGQYRGAIAALEAAESEATQLTADQLEELTAGLDDLEAKIDAMTSADRAIASAVQGATQEYANAKDNAVKVSPPPQESENKQQSQESLHLQTRPLTEGQVYLLFKRVDIAQTYLVEAGVLSRAGSVIKGAAKGAGQKIKQAGKRMANKVTADQLTKAWQQAGSPADSEELYQFLQDQGVSADIIAPVYDTMKLPVPDDQPADNTGDQDQQTQQPTDQDQGTEQPTDDPGKQAAQQQPGAKQTDAAAKPATLKDVVSKLAYIRNRDKQTLLRDLKKEVEAA